MRATNAKSAAKRRRSYSEEFKQEAVQMLLDGHSALSVANRLGLSGPNLLYRWKREAVRRGGPAARSLDDRVGMGATGRSGLLRLLMGSVTRRVLQHLPCSLLTVKDEDLVEDRSVRRTHLSASSTNPERF
jgi:transposase